MNVKKVLEIVKRQNYVLGFEICLFEPNGVSYGMEPEQEALSIVSFKD